MSLEDIASIIFAVTDICTTVMLEKMVTCLGLFSSTYNLFNKSLSIHNITKGHRSCSGLTHRCF